MVNWNYKKYIGNFLLVDNMNNNDSQIITEINTFIEKFIKAYPK